VRRLEKPWGHELVWAETASYVGKILHIRAGLRLSLQFHRRKEETMYVQEGEVEATIEGDDGGLSVRILGPGGTIHVRPGRRHRLRALRDSTIFEVSTPELGDIVRVEDDWGRSGSGGGEDP
jgi:mannose-6-phosphate isomerase-like protein (cupin superfamily)